MAQRLHDFIFNHMMVATKTQIDWVWRRDMESIIMAENVWRQSILISNKKY